MSVVLIEFNFFIKGKVITERILMRMNQISAFIIVRSSQEAKIALHLDEFIGVVRFKGSFEIECLIAVGDHLLGFLLVDEGRSVGRGR